MPALAREFSQLILDADLPLDDESPEPLQELSTAELALVAERAVNLLGVGWGNALVDLGVDRGSIQAPIGAADLNASAAFQGILSRGVEVHADSTDTALVTLLQHAFMAVAGRIAGAPKELALAHWGADGSMGGETRTAIAAFQRWRRIPGLPGVFRAAEASALASLLADHPPPDLFAAAPPAVSLPSPELFQQLYGGGVIEEYRPPTTPPTTTPTTTPTITPTPTPTVVPSTPAPVPPPPLSRPIARIVEIARGIANAVEAPFTIQVGGITYSYKASHFGVEPAFTGLLKAPGGVAYSVRPDHNYWKCNIFGGTVLALAEVPVPTHGVGRFRHFPRAERFGDALARSRGWKMIVHLDHRDPEKKLEEALVGDAQNEEIRAMLAQIRPGDVFFADNPGPPGSDGGHTRVCVEAAAAGDPDVAPLFAQARYPAACLQRDGMNRVAYGRQIQFWLLRYVG
ncbi:MAG: hypothetical protein R3B09_14265 [Nannocystaceae bacterium]